MADVFVVYDTAAVTGGWHRIESVHQTQAAANAHAAAGAGVTAYAGAIAETEADGIDVDDLINASNGNVSPLDDVVTAAARNTAEWKARLADAWSQYNGREPSARQDWWVRIGGVDAALTATDRWAYHAIALGDLIADGSWPTVDNARAGAIEHIATVIATLGATWYGVVSGSGKATERGQYAGQSCDDGAAIYTDLIIDARCGTRAPDAAWTPMPGAVIAAGFRPDTPTLR